MASCTHLRSRSTSLPQHHAGKGQQQIYTDKEALMHGYVSIYNQPHGMTRLGTAAGTMATDNLPEPSANPTSIRKWSKAKSTVDLVFQNALTPLTNCKLSLNATHGQRRLPKLHQGQSDLQNRDTILSTPSRR